MDRTLILVKPDAFARRLTGEVIARFERKGLHLVALRLMTLDEQTAKRHYSEHEGKPFFGGLVAFITSGPLVAMVLEGPNAIEAARKRIRLDQDQGPVHRSDLLGMVERVQASERRRGLGFLRGTSPSSASQYGQSFQVGSSGRPQLAHGSRSLRMQLGQRRKSSLTS